MFDLGCQEMSGNVKDILGAILLIDGFILVTLSMDQKNMVILGAFQVDFWP